MEDDPQTKSTTDPDAAELEARTLERGQAEMAEDIATGKKVWEAIDREIEAADGLSDTDLEKISAIEPRIEKILDARAKSVAEAMEYYHAESRSELADRIFRFRETGIPLFAEIGETGGWLTTSEGGRNMWAGSRESAETRYAGAGGKNMYELAEELGGEVIAGKTSDAAKVEVFKALGVVEEGETLLEALSRHNMAKGGDGRIWDQEYDVKVPTNVEGAEVRITFRSAHRNPGMGLDDFEASLII